MKSEPWDTSVFRKDPGGNSTFSRLDAQASFYRWSKAPLETVVNDSSLIVEDLFNLLRMAKQVQLAIKEDSEAANRAMSKGEQADGQL